MVFVSRLWRCHRQGLIAMVSGLVLLSVTTRAAFAQDAAPRPTPRLTPRLRPRAVPPAARTDSTTSSSAERQAAPKATPSDRPRAVAAPARPTRKTTAPSETVEPRDTPRQESRSEQRSVASDQATSSWVSALGPPMLPAYRGVDPPLGYKLTTRHNTPLIVSGALTWGGTYLGSLIVAASDKFKNGTGALAVPLVGPWIAIGTRHVDCQVTVSTKGGNIDDNIDQSTDDATRCFVGEAATIAVMTGMGVGQLIGASLLLAGVLDHRRYYLRADLGSVSVTPVFDTSLLGLVVRGHL